MTAQIPESLRYEGEEVAMCSNPLDTYFAMGGRNPRFDVNCSALWRGYVGRWEVVGDRLYLLALEGQLDDGAEASLETVFPGFPERVFAHWYSGTVRVPRGRQIKYVHGGYASVFEQDLFLSFDRGVLSRSWIRQNGVAESDDAPTHYAVAAMTVVPRGGTTSEEKS
jgi:hypothetical protein